MTTAIGVILFLHTAFYLFTAILGWRQFDNLDDPLSTVGWRNTAAIVALVSWFFALCTGFAAAYMFGWRP